MEQLQKDRDYTKFLIRTIEKEIRKNSFKNKNELMNFINGIRQDLNTKQVIDYVNNNRLIFNYQEFQMKINQVINNFDIMMQNLQIEKMRQMQQMQMQKMQQASYQNQQPSYVPITKVDVNSISKELIEKINFLIVNPKIDVNNVLVDTKTGNFVDFVNKKPIVIIHNKETNAFEIMGEKKEEKQEIKPKKVEEKKEEVKQQSKVRTKKLIMPKIIENNKAFISTVLVTAVCAISGIVIASLILVK